MQYLNLSPGAGALERFSEGDNGTLIPQGSSAFRPIYTETIANLRRMLAVPGDGEVLLLSCSGTGGVEALLVSVLEAGDRILVVSNGYFGDRLARMARSLGFDPHVISSDWRRPFDVTMAMDYIRSRHFPGTKAVFTVHLETSTGVVNDIATIGTAVRETDALYLVDAVSSVGPHHVDMTQWAVDGLATVSYKGLLTTPALTMVAMSDRYYKQMADTQHRGYYLDLERNSQFAHGNTTAGPIPTLALTALRHVTSDLLAQDLEQYEEQCRATAERIRSGLISLGFALYPESGHSHGVTALWLPGQFRAVGGQAAIQDRYGVYVGDGLGPLRGEIIRIGHFRPMGDVELSAIFDVFEKIANGTPHGGWYG